MTCIHGKCIVNELGYAICDCDPGYKGFSCYEEVDECAEEGEVCKNGGQCVNTVGSFYCKCGSEFGGDFCQTELESELVSRTPKQLSNSRYFLDLRFKAGEGA